ncbi:DUF466 domain-containing protein [Gammaproteobacteria bacterium]
MHYWWRRFRCLIGNNRYERYLHHHATVHADTPPLDRRAFYLREQEHKWSGVRRCC